MTKEEQAKKELSDFLDGAAKKIPYSCPNWNSSQGRMYKPYEQNSSFSNRYRLMSPLEQTQYIDEEDIPNDVDWALPDAVIEAEPVGRKKYRWAMALAFLTAFSISYCSNIPNSQKEEPKKYEIERPVNQSNHDAPAFRQGPKK